MREGGASVTWVGTLGGAEAGDALIASMAWLAFDLLAYSCATRQILQAKIFGGFTRWFFDVPPPAPDVPGRTILTTASTAYRYSVASAPPGPVHLNLQVRCAVARSGGGC